MWRRVLGTARRLGIEELIDATPSRRRNLVVAMLIAQVIAPGSKLATARGLRAETATSSLGQVLGVAGCDEDDLYAAMDWVLERQEDIENALAARHLTNGTLVLYDVSSAAFEGHTCPLGKIGHPRDGVKGRLQIVYGLLLLGRRGADRDRGVRGQHRRPENPDHPSEQTQTAVRACQGTVNLSNPRAIFASSPPRFTRSRVTYEAYVVSRTSTRPQVDSAALGYSIATQWTSAPRARWPSRPAFRKASSTRY